MGASDAWFMREEDFVVGFVVDQTAYAMPWWILKNYHTPTSQSKIRQSR